jgi:hypothetical protein
MALPLGGLISGGGGGGFANPMTTAGDIIVGGVAGAPARLAAGSAGYVLRSVAGTPAWRELSAAGLAAARPNAVATREGQTYWSTDGAAGLELAMVVHKGGTTYDWETLAYDVTATGAALVQAADAAAARAALCDRAISLAGLTATNGNGTAVAATGTLSYANGQTGLVYADYPRLVGAHGTSIWAFDASVRITITGAGSANTAASLGIGSTGSVYNSLVMIRLFGDGQIDGLDLSGSPVWSVYTPGTVPVDGTGWLRVRVQAGVMTFWTGVGATYATAAWTIRYRALLSSPPSPDTTYPSLGLALYQAVNPGAPGVQAVYSNFTIRDLP